MHLLWCTFPGCPGHAAELSIIRVANRAARSRIDMLHLVERLLKKRCEDGQREAIHVVDGSQVLDQEVHGGAALHRDKVTG